MYVLGKLVTSELPLLNEYESERLSVQQAGNCTSHPRLRVLRYNTIGTLTKISKRGEKAIISVAQDNSVDNQVIPEFCTHGRAEITKQINCD